MTKAQTKKLISVFLLLIVAVFVYFSENSPKPASDVASVTLDEIPAYTGEPYVVVDDGVVDYDEPFTETYIQLSELDSLGRCGVAEAVLGPETLATEERGSIGNVRPSGWPTKIGNAKYDFVDGKYLYNRCHLLAFSLSGLNAEPKNLITGARTLNIQGMWAFEEMTLDYIQETGNHVFYRVTPVFVDSELVARGVHMEAKSVEDNGLEFNIYAFNNEPGVEIDYATGDNWEAE